MKKPTINTKSERGKKNTLGATIKHQNKGAHSAPEILVPYKSKQTNFTGHKKLRQIVEISMTIEDGIT